MKKQTIHFVVIYSLLALCIGLLVFSFIKPKQITPQEIYANAINGIISQRELIVNADGKTITAIQCALNITDGNSGGALLNANGELIGITTFRLKDTAGNVIYGTSFAIPTSVVIDFVQ